MSSEVESAPDPLTPHRWRDLPAPVRVRVCVNALTLATPWGLLVARLGRADVRRGPRGLVLADHYRLGLPVAGAFTVGDVVLTRHSWPALARRRPTLLGHEEVHAWQWACCGGLPFLALYTAAAAWSWIRTGHPAAANPFERAAGLADGGYRELPARAAGAALDDVRRGARELAGALRRGRHAPGRASALRRRPGGSGA